jgi:hypothetical protein
MAKVFAGFDLKNFWKGKKPLAETPLTAGLVKEVQKRLGYTLPQAYVELMKVQNGGTPRNCAYPTKGRASREASHVWIRQIYGIGYKTSRSLCGSMGSAFWMREWGYPPIGVYFADCPSAGHDMLCLDYRACGPTGEPAVVHVAQESKYKITPVAPDFASFIRGLVSEDDVDDDED